MHAGGGELVTLDQALRIIAACGDVIGHEIEHAGEQQLGIVEHLARHRDLCQQAHRLDLVAMFDEIGADHLLGGFEFAIVEQRGGGNHRGRQGGERRDMRGGERGIRRVAAKAIHPLEHPPAHRQGRVERDRAQQRGDRRPGVFARDVAQAAFLQHLAVSRVQQREAIERDERLGDTPRHPQADRLDQQQVAIFGIAREQLRRPAQDFVMRAPRLERAQLRDRREDWYGGGVVLDHGVSLCRYATLERVAYRLGRVHRQKSYPIRSPNTRGRSGTSALMNSVEEVKVLACELFRLVPNSCAFHCPREMPIDASTVA